MKRRGGAGEQQHIAGRDDLFAREKAPDQRGEVLVGDAVLLAVPLLEDDPRTQVGVDPVEVLRVDRPPELVLLA